MKREITRERTLPAIRLDVAEFRLLWSRCLAHFDAQGTTVKGLVIRQPQVKLRFASLDELVACEELPSEVSDFEFWIRQTDSLADRPVDRFLLLRAKPDLPPFVHADGESESWSAGAVEVVHAFAVQHQASLSWLRSLPFWPIVLLGFVPSLSILIRKYFPGTLELPPQFELVWSLVVLFLVFFQLSKSRYFPPATLVVREQLGFFGKYAVQLSLAIAFVALLVAIVGLFIGK